MVKSVSREIVRKSKTQPYPVPGSTDQYSSCCITWSFF